MAVLSNAALNLADIATRLDPDGKVATIVELFTQQNPILQDMGWIEGNLPTGHRTTVRTGLPGVSLRALNSGVTPSKSTTAQIDEGCAIIEAFSEVDVDLVKLNGNEPQYRLSEGQAFIEAMNQQQAQLLFYGNANTNPLAFNGLAPRYNSLTGGTSQNIITGGGSGSDNTSVWLVVWGPNTVTGIYPKGSQAGLLHEDLGEQVIQTGTGLATGRLKAYVDRWQWKCGLVVRDWRYAVRLCNIDVSNLATEAGATDLIKGMVKMIHRVPALGMGRPVFYCSRTTREMLDIQAMNKASNQLTIDTVAGKPVTSLRGIPIQTCDQILETEATVA
jgi:hypothetical protein